MVMVLVGPRRPKQLRVPSVGSANWGVGRGPWTTGCGRGDAADDEGSELGGIPVNEGGLGRVRFVFVFDI